MIMCVAGVVTTAYMPLHGKKVMKEHPTISFKITDRIENIDDEDEIKKEVKELRMPCLAIIKEEQNENNDIKTDAYIYKDNISVLEPNEYAIPSDNTEKTSPDDNFIFDGNWEVQSDPVIAEPVNLDYGNGIHFDQLFPYADVSWGYYASDCQPYIDANCITYFAGDYYHHNTGGFMKYFWQLQPGTVVYIGGHTFVCDGIEHAVCGDWNITTDSGREVYDNGTVEIITCAGGPHDSGRYVAYLLPI